MAFPKPRPRQRHPHVPPSSAAAHTNEIPRSNVPRATFFRSFIYAFRGIFYVVRTQRNMQVHLGIGALAVALGLFLGLSWGEWAALIVAMTVVYCLEMVNTVVEATVDLITREYHPLAQVAKDAAAGAVLLGAIGAIGVGIVLFLPKLLRLLFGWFGWPNPFV